MATAFKARTIGIAALTIAVAVALGYWGYTAHKKRELRKAVAVLVKHASGRLREALDAETGPAPVDRRKAAKQHDTFAAATEKDMAQLKRLELELDRAFTDDADAHLLTVREIFRRRAASHRLFLLQDDSVAALQDHMRVDRRARDWSRQAVRAKERAERDFRDYQLKVAAYATLLDSFPTSQKKIAVHVEPAALLDEALIASARDRALGSARQSAAEIEAARKLLAAR